MLGALWPCPDSAGLEVLPVSKDELLGNEISAKDDKSNASNVFSTLAQALTDPGADRQPKLRCAEGLQHHRRTGGRLLVHVGPRTGMRQ